MNISEIPAELRELPQWVGWKHTTRAGKPTKLPINPTTNRVAKTDDPSTWASFADAVTAIDTYELDGVGFVFSENDPYCGIDLDHDIDQDLVDYLDSYTERSQSGRGLHIIVRASIGGGRRNGTIEIYDRKRFFIFTGDRVNERPIEDRQAQVETILETIDNHKATEPNDVDLSAFLPKTPALPANESIIDKILASNQANKFRRLWAGDLSGHGNDHSRADAALLSILRFWTRGDKGECFRLFSQSALAREKWEREDYRERTWASIDNGETLSDRTAGMPTPTIQAPTPSDLVSAAYYLSTRPPPVDPIISELFDSGDKAVIIGSSKARKSFFTLQLAMSLASCRFSPLSDGLSSYLSHQFLGHQIPKGRRVLLIQLEIKPAHKHRRVHNMGKAMSITAEDLGDRLCIVNGRGRKFSAQSIIDLAQQMDAEVIIIDPIYILMDGDENNTDAWRSLLAGFDHICNESGASLIAVHHEKKGIAGDRDAIDRGAGSGILSRFFDCGLYLAAHQTEEETIVFSTITRNYPPSLPQSIVWSEGCFVLSSAAPIERTSKTPKKERDPDRFEPVKEHILEVLEKGLITGTDLLADTIRRIGASKHDIENARRQLCLDGKIKSARTLIFPAKTYYGFVKDFPQDGTMTFIDPRTKAGEKA